MTERPRLVVADDNPAFAELIAAGLRTDYDVVVVPDGREALEECRKGAALLISDVGMPEMDAEKLLKELKKDPRTAKLPVVIATATHFHTASRKRYEADPQVKAIFCKPFQIEELFSRVRSLVTARSA